MNGSNAASAASYNDMHPRQAGLDYRIHIAFNMLFMPFEVPFEVYVRGGTVRNDDRILANVLTYYFVQRVSTQIVNHQHLYVMDNLSDALPFRLFSQFGRLPHGLLRCLGQVLLQHRVDRLAFNDDKHFGLLLASCTAFNLLAACLFRKRVGKNASSSSTLSDNWYMESRFPMMFLNSIIISHTGGYCSIRNWCWTSFAESTCLMDVMRCMA